MTPLANVAATVIGTVYGQLVVKWRVDEAGDLPGPFGDRVEYALELLIDPWVLTAVAAALVASLAWMAAISKLELSRAYPYMSASFVLVLVFSALLFSEAITAPKGIGVALIAGGLVAVSRGMSRVPFNQPYATGKELGLIDEAIAAAHLSANGPFGERCREWIESSTGTHAALLMNSGTAALEAAMLIAGVGPGDEVIMPSYTYVSTANAVALRGATPVFVDVREDTLNLDERLVEDAVTEKTRALVAVHYAGVACALEQLGAIAERHGLLLIEDAAQGVMASWRERSLGSVGALGALSFHETKNVTCGEGGALLVNDPALLEQAEVVREKGTNRAEFRAGRTDHYEWVGLGSSYELSDLASAFLWGQLQEAEAITAMRLEAWEAYHRALEPLEADGLLRRPVVPEGCGHNGHMYYLLASDRRVRDGLIAGLDSRDVDAVFHYVPLHSSPAGRRLGRAHGELPVTGDAAGRLLRVPLWAGLGQDGVGRVVAALNEALREL